MEIRKIEWNVEFKKEMTELEIYGIEKVVDTYYNNEELDFNSEDLGLAYTSSSKYAMYNVCNGSFFYECNEELEVSYFAVTTQGHLVMVTYDEEENEIMFELV